MKKKLVSLVLALTLVFTLILPVSAVSEAVQASQDAYNAIITAMDNKDLAALKTATENFEAANENLTDKEMEEFYTSVCDDLLTVIFEAAGIIGMADMIDTFNTEPNLQNALMLVDAYDSCYDGEMFDQEFTELLEDMIPNIQDVYNEALTLLPSDDVMEVYEAYYELEWIMIFVAWYDEDFLAACDGFEAVLDTFNNLSEEDLNDLAILLEEPDGETVSTVILNMWKNANIVKDIGKFYDNPTLESAKILVAHYDSIYNNPENENVDQDFLDSLEQFFEIDELYKQASKMIAKSEEEKEKDKLETNKKDDKEEVSDEKAVTEDKKEKDNKDKSEVLSPATGDPTSFALPFVMLLIAMGAFICLKKEKYN